MGGLHYGIWVHPGFHKRTERTATAHCHARIRNFRKPNLHGQAVREGLRPEELPEVGSETEKGRYPCGQEYRPAGAELRGNSGTVANDYQGKAGGHRGAGYAVARHPAEPGPDRNSDCGHRFAATVLCCPDRTGIHPPATGGGHRRRQTQRGKIWPQTHGSASGV